MRRAELCCLQTCHHDGEGGLVFGRMVGNIIAVDGGGLDVIRTRQSNHIFTSQEHGGNGKCTSIWAESDCEVVRDEADSNAADASNEVGEEDEVSTEAEVAKTEQQRKEPPKH